MLGTGRRCSASGMCGDTEGRLPTDQGFDEWWGYPQQRRRGRLDHLPTRHLAEAIAKARGIEAPQIWEGKKGGQARPRVRELELGGAPVARRADRQAQPTDYIKRPGRSQPAVLHLRRASHLHPPEGVHPDFDQTVSRTTGAVPRTSSPRWTTASGRSWTASRKPGSPTTRSWCSPATTPRAASRSRQINGPSPGVVHRPHRGRGRCVCRRWSAGRKGAGRRGHRGDAVGP